METHSSCESGRRALGAGPPKRPVDFDHKSEGEPLEERRLAAVMAADMVSYSRLMELDEQGTIARQKAHRAELIDPKIAECRGRIVKTTGDGMLVEFASVVEAVACAVSIQTNMRTRETEIEQDSRIRYRIGINLGDLLLDGDDILGDGVNIAARLEAMSDPGGVLISDVVYQSVAGKLDLEFEDLGPRSVKNISKPVHMWRWIASGAAGYGVSRAETTEQEIRFCLAEDATRIAYATVGSGPPLVRAPNWMTHLEYDWQNPVWRHLVSALSRNHQLVRFDQRGNGLSDWDPPELSFDSIVTDIEAVVGAAGLTRFPLLGISQGCAYSIAYAVRYPQRVTRLVLYGGFAAGRRRTGSEGDMRQADLQRQLIRDGWGQDNPAFRQFFTSLFMPNASKEQMDWFNDLQRVTTSPESATRLRDVVDNLDVRELAGQVAVPTLVMHGRDDGMVPFEAGRRMAALIPGARFVALDSANHLMLEDEPAWQRFLNEVRAFLDAE